MRYQFIESDGDVLGIFMGITWIFIDLQKILSIHRNIRAM